MACERVASHGLGTSSLLWPGNETGSKECTREFQLCPQSAVATVIMSTAVVQWMYTLVRQGYTFWVKISFITTTNVRLYSYLDSISFLSPFNT